MEKYRSIKIDGWDTWHKEGIGNPYLFGTDKWAAWDDGQSIARNGKPRPAELKNPFENVAPQKKSFWGKIKSLF